MFSCMSDEKTREKVRENRLRRVAGRRGLVLRRSRRRDVRALDYGQYRLTDVTTGRVRTDGVTLDEIEAYLSR
jgi:hypothetical protein